MKGTGAGWDSCLYRIFIVFAILTVVGGTVYTALTEPPGSQVPLYVGVGGVAVFMVILVGYWILQIIFKGYGNLKAPDVSLKGNVHDLSVLQNWNTLFSAMVIHESGSEEIQKAVKKGNSSLVIWFLWAAVIVLCPIALMVPYAFGLLDWSYIRYGVMGYLGIVFFMILLTAFLGGRAAEASEEVMLAPLGLMMVEIPFVGADGTGGLRARGQMVMEGKRSGRGVQITVELNRITTRVDYPAPVFQIHGEDGNLQVEDGAPQFIYDALKNLRREKYWERLKISGDSSAIVAVRNAKGKNVWLYDLWLIERIINEIERESKAKF